MPDLTPDEGDRCPHCDATLTDTPNCCAAMVEEWDAEISSRDRRDKHDPPPQTDYNLLWDYDS